MENKNEKLQSILSRAVDNKKVFGTTLCLQAGDYTFCGASGNFQTEDQYFIASTTKLFVTAIILKLKEQGALQLNDPIAKYLDAAILEGLHTYKEKDCTKQLTIKHLLAHTSGLPDYFQKKGPNGKSLEDEIIKGEDQGWTFEQAIARSKAMTPLFTPGKKGKAHYSDTNYQLLGKVIENITGKDFATAVQEFIAQPLGLLKTYLYQDPEDTRPKALYYKREELHIPKAMASFGPDGGIVSTAPEMLTFLKAFFGGKLFPDTYLKGLQQWNSIFYPLESGIGVHRFKVPWFFSPFKPIPEIIGHSGLSGAFAFYSPAKELFLTGTVNQISSPGTSFRLMLKVMNQF